jgi:hypothetical protein
MSDEDKRRHDQIVRVYAVVRRFLSRDEVRLFLSEMVATKVDRPFDSVMKRVDDHADKVLDTETDEALLQADGWTVECSSPFEIRHKDGSFATGQAAEAVLFTLRYG